MAHQGQVDLNECNIELGPSKTYRGLEGRKLRIKEHHLGLAVSKADQMDRLLGEALSQVRAMTPWQGKLWCIYRPHAGP